MKRKNEGSLNNDAPDLLEDDIDVTLDEATFEELELARYQNKVAEILRLKAPEEVIKKVVIQNKSFMLITTVQT